MALKIGVIILCKDNLSNLKYFEESRKVNDIMFVLRPYIDNLMKILTIIRDGPKFDTSIAIKVVS